MAGIEECPRTWLLLLAAPLVVGLVALLGLVRAFRWAESPLEQTQLEAVPWPAPGPFERALVVILDGVHPRDAFDEQVSPFLSAQQDRARHGMAMVPYVAFTNTCIRTLFSGVGFDLLAAMKNFRADRFGEDNLFRRVARSGGASAVVTDDILWQSLFGEDIDDIRFRQTPPDSPPETGDLAVAQALPSVWRDESFRLVVGHFAALDLVGHRLGTEDAGYQDHVRAMGEVVRELAEDLRDGELLCVFSDHGSDVSGGHAGGEQEGRESFFFLYSVDGRIVPGGPDTISQKDISATLAAALGVAIPDVSEGQVQTSWFAIDTAAREAMRDNNLAQLRAGPAREVEGAESVDDPGLLMRQAALLGASRLRWQSWGYVLFGCVVALAGILWIRRLLHPEPTMPRTALAAGLALVAAVVFTMTAIRLLGEDISDSVSPWWVRGVFAALFAIVVPLSLSAEFSARMRRFLPEAGVAFLLPTLVLLGLVPLTLRVGFYQLAVLGVALAACFQTMAQPPYRESERTTALWIAALMLMAFVGLRLLIESQRIDVDSIDLGAATGWLTSLVLAIWVLLSSGSVKGPARGLWVDRLGFLFCVGSSAASFFVPDEGAVLTVLLIATGALLAGAWWAGSPTGMGALGALLGMYRYLSTDAEVILLCMILIGVSFLLQGLRVERFNQLALATPVALALFTYTLYALDEPLSFQRINVLIGDVVGVGGRNVLATVLLAAMKYIVPLTLFVTLLFRDARRVAAPLVCLLAWALVFRLIGGIVVVSNHPQNFGEVTRIVGESIISVVLLVVLTTGTAICIISPAFVRIRARANGRGEAT